MKYHLTHIFEKLGVSDRRELAELTMKIDLMDTPSLRGSSDGAQ